jgi:hypothetical protein
MKRFTKSEKIYYNLRECRNEYRQLSTFSASPHQKFERNSRTLALTSKVEKSTSLTF